MLSEVYPSDKLLVVEYDVGDPAHSVEALFQKIHEHFGRIDVVVNNAGYALNSVVEGSTDEEARNQFEVNFWGAVRISCEVRTCVCQRIGVTDRDARLSNISVNTTRPQAAFSTSRLSVHSERLQPLYIILRAKPVRPHDFMKEAFV